MYQPSVVTLEHMTFLGFIKEMLCTISNITLTDYIMIVNAANSNVEQNYQH